MEPHSPSSGDPETRDGSGAAPKPRQLISTPVLVGLIAGALIIVSFAVAIVRTGGRGEEGSLTLGGEPRPGGRSEELKLLSPIGTVPHGTLELHWTPASGVEEYEAIILDNRALPVWRSGRTRATSVTVPERGMRHIIPGPTYFWRVNGYRPDGTEVESGSERFVIAG